MLMLLFSAPEHHKQSEPKMLRLRLGQAAICSGLPILAHQAHSANMGTKSRDYIYGSTLRATEVDGAVARNTRRGAQRIAQEGTKLRFAHLARGHGELAMASGGHRMPPNPHIVERVEESRIDTRPLADDPLQEFAIPAIATPHPVIPKNPDVAWLRSWRCGNRRDDLVIRVDS